MGQQSHTAQTVTSTGAATVSFGFTARNILVKNSTAGPTAFANFAGVAATASDYPIPAGGEVQITNAPSSSVSLIVSTASTSNATVNVLGLH